MTGKEYSRRRKQREPSSSSSTQEDAKDADFDSDCLKEREAEIASSMGTSQSGNENEPMEPMGELSPVASEPSPSRETVKEARTRR